MFRIVQDDYRPFQGVFGQPGPIGRRPAPRTTRCRARAREEICLKCDYVMAGDLSGIMFNHVSEFPTVSKKSLFFMSNSSISPSDKVQI